MGAMLPALLVVFTGCPTTVAIEPLEGVALPSLHAPKQYPHVRIMGTHLAQPAAHPGSSLAAFAAVFLLGLAPSSWSRTLSNSSSPSFLGQSFLEHCVVFEQKQRTHFPRGTWHPQPKQHSTTITTATSTKKR